MAYSQKSAGALPECSGCGAGTGGGIFRPYVGENYSPGGILVIGHSAYSRGNGSWLADFRNSQTGRYFEPLLQECGVSLDSIALTNSYKCLLPDGRSAPKESALSECSERHLSGELAALKPGRIISWGAPVLALLSEGEIALETKGTEFEYLGLPVFAMYHPAYQVTRDPRREAILPGLKEFLSEKRTG